MRQRLNSAIRQTTVFCLLTSSLACAPTVDLVGVYFPGWLVSTIAGVALSYGIIVWLARRPGSSSLAGSGILFSSLAVGISLAVWLVWFSGF